MDELHEQSQRDRTEVRQVEHELSARLFRDIRENKGRGMMEDILGYVVVELREINSTLSLIREALEKMNKNALNDATNTEQGNVGIAMQNCIVLHFFVHLDITGLKRYSINISQSLFELYIQKAKYQQRNQNNQFCDK